MQIDLVQKNLDQFGLGSVVDLRSDANRQEDEYKIWGFFRKDLVLSPGKLAAQSGHAFGSCMVLAQRENPEVLDKYLSFGQPKIAVGVSDEKQLLAMVRLCQDAGLIASLVLDSGRTELSGKTYTAGAVGPCKRSELPNKIKRLQLFK